ncbi:gallidermin/nisin family lantibiotic [Clostridium estertheticum]|uniref:Gallidermin/nisin family lantibiotic n=1 Tax=Clostridium estertheticum TaxID=238834 RepID=A0A7Y3T0C5_9CLOT|nr:gallidermin/nisin family lantibiotic [Clostridium estertheticum]MBW9154335.1 gallidermin/nisin family lantibiotic [Clostridium estertheticum]MBX4267245.1 gallidermin/nisin family lantibiotic [Clostridium estertheticum]MBX4267527.1 gallidermin/nisin family lantibiotic [Clostridium estertheticum]MBX4267528.1 gallidermin/nisin family lantibiotic [Clostridium estertheticum]MCB2309185.1 gallidermin/nisin family lantibiotic [Clostridium estertheticum]
MAKFDDFDLDVKVSKTSEKDKEHITSWSLCTAGCITGRIMGCNK